MYNLFTVKTYDTKTKEKTANYFTEEKTCSNFLNSMLGCLFDTEGILTVEVKKGYCPLCIDGEVIKYSDGIECNKCGYSEKWS